jgi:hypothetical protein
MAYERKSYLVGAAGLVVAVVALGISYQALRASWQIAELSGSLDKSEIEVGIGDLELPRSQAIYLISGTKELSNNSGLVVGGIPIRIASTGKKSLEAVTLTFQYHPFFKRSLLERSDGRQNGDIGPIALQRSLLEDRDWSFMSYKIPMLNPGISASIVEPFFMEPTTVKDVVRTRFRDGKSMNLAYEVRYSKQFAFNVGAKDTGIRSYSVSLTVAQAESMQDLLRKEANLHIESRRREIRKGLTTIEYLAGLITSSPKENAYVLFVNTEPIEGKDLKLYVIKGEPQVGLLEYKILAWPLLFSAPKEV